jgi:hypothetical protein
MQNTQDSGMGSPPGDSAGTAREMKDKVGGVVAGAKEFLVEGAKARATGAIDERKGNAAQSLGTVAEALREAANKLGEGEAGPLGSYAESAAEQVDKVARYLREKDLQSLSRDAQTFARRHPEVFLGGAFLAGIFAARFLKSSGQRQTTGSGGMGYESAGYQGYQGYQGYEGSQGYQGGYGQGGYGQGNSAGYAQGTGYGQGSPSGYGQGNSAGFAQGAGTGAATGTAYSTDADTPFNPPKITPIGGE